MTNGPTGPKQAPGHSPGANGPAGPPSKTDIVEHSVATLAAENPDALLLDGFEGAFIGFARQQYKAPLAVYDRHKCLEILRTRDGMTHEEAEEFFSFNTEGAWVGPNTPLILTRGSIRGVKLVVLCRECNAVARDVDGLQEGDEITCPHCGDQWDYDSDHDGHPEQVPTLEGHRP